jgi:hypothetical protein
MRLAHDVQSVAHVIKKGGRGSRGKKQVIDITPIVLAEIRDGIRGLSEKMDGLGRRMDGLEGRMDGLESGMVKLRQEMYGEINKLRVHAQRRCDLLERRVTALEVAEFRQH